MKTSSSAAIAPQRWEDVVFENRNQAYGAYVLRKGYGKNVFIGLVITAVIVTIVMFFPAIVEFFKGEEVIEKAPPKKLVYTEL